MKRFFIACLATGLLAACSESTTAPAAFAPVGTGPLLAAASAVTVNSTFDVTLQVFVPCANGGAGEDVLVSGPLHDLFHITSNGNGFHIKFQDQSRDISGVGLVTGAKYQANFVTQFEANLTAGIEQTFVNSFLMIGQGPGNDFTVRENFHVTINANGVVTSFHDNFRVDCIALQGAIAFHSNRDGDFDIYVMNADGTDVTNLTNSTDQEVDPIWSPNGRQVAFAKCAGGCEVWFPEVWVINADGSGLKQLTHGGGFLGAWSPDGKRIAFVRDGVGILVMNADGTGVTPIHQDGRPTAWSPNGKQILFQSDRDGDNELYVMNVDGSRVTQLTDSPASDEGDFAGWSPDGKRIVFSSRRDGGDLDLFVMNADGSGVTQLTQNDFIADDDPVWSPDGKHIAFHSTRDGDEEIFVINADGSNPIQLTFNEGVFDAVPAWRASPLP